MNDNKKIGHRKTNSVITSPTNKLFKSKIESSNTIIETNNSKLQHEHYKKPPSVKYSVDLSTNQNYKENNDNNKENSIIKKKSTFVSTRTNFSSNNSKPPVIPTSAEYFTHQHKESRELKLDKTKQNFFNKETSKKNIKEIPQKVTLQIKNKQVEKTSYKLDLKSNIGYSLIKLHKHIIHYNI